MKDLKSIFSLNGVNYHDLEDSDKVMFDKITDTLTDDFKRVKLTGKNYFSVCKGASGKISFDSIMPEPIDTKIWETLVGLMNE